MEYPKFKVCCRCFTFNQAKYITDAMNGFTMQQTSFPFVSTIVDDASTDGEQEVIRKYVEDNFDFSEGSVAYHKETDYAHITYAQHKANKNCYFAVLYLKENHYSQRKPKLGYLSEWRDMCEYEAICEGDDYWIAGDKLHKQVNFMNNHPDCGMCYTKSKMYDQSTNSFLTKTFGGPGTTSDYFIFTGNPVPTATVMLRFSAHKQYLEAKRQLPEFKMGDYVSWLWMSANSKIAFLPVITSVYRLLPKSASHSDNPRIEFINSSYDLRCYFHDLLGYTNKEIIERQRVTKILKEYAYYKYFRQYMQYFIYAIQKDWKNLFVIENWAALWYFIRISK